MITLYIQYKLQLKHYVQVFVEINFNFDISHLRASKVFFVSFLVLAFLRAF